MDHELASQVVAYLKESAELKQAVAHTAALPNQDAVLAHSPGISRASGNFSPAIQGIVRASRLIAQAFEGGSKLMLCGNGGSAADCQHVAAEFTGILTKDVNRPGLPAIALTTDTSFLTAYANDRAFEEIFSRQVEALGKPGDVLLAISTSGDSPNVLRAVEAAHALKIYTIGLCGQRGRLANTVDVAIRVPSVRTSHIQETHLAIEHAMCELVEGLLYPNERTKARATDGEIRSDAI